MRREHSLDLLDNRRGVLQPSLALVTAGEVAGGGIDNRDATRFQPREVLDHGRMRIHVHVHRGREGNRALRGEQDRRHDVVGDTDRGLGDYVGAGGRDHDRVGGVGEPDMADLGFLVRLKVSVATGLALSVCSVSGVMNSAALRDIITRTRACCAVSNRTSSAALYAAIPPHTPTTIVLSFSTPIKQCPPGPEF